MMPFDFPSPATVGQQFTPAGGPTYTFSGTGWTTAGQPSSAILAQQVFTASGTYTPTPGMQTAIIECVGGGGGGNGAPGVASTYVIAGGGGSGGYSRKFVTAGTGPNGVGTSQVVTIGTGGSGGAAGANAGGAGGDTSVGTLCIGKGARAVPAGDWNVPGSGGVVGTGDIVAAGNPGGGGSYLASASGYVFSGNGASSIYGGGGVLPTNYGPGTNATNYGSGGSGGFTNTTTSYGGGNGSSGIVIITEYGNVSVGAGTAAWNDAGFQNKFRNGMMDVAQRGTSGTTAAGANNYTLDGWIIGSNGAGTPWSQQYSQFLSSNALRISGAAVTSQAIYHRIESSIAAQLLNKNKTAQPITIQLTIYNNTSAPITPQLRTAFPTAQDNFASTTADTGLGSLGNFPAITNGTSATIAVTFVPNLAVGSLQFGYQVQLTFSPLITAGSVDISYADIRATPGVPTGLNNNPPPVEMRPIQQELAFCQRYYTLMYVGLQTNVSVASVNIGTNYTFPVPMRAVPSVANIAAGLLNNATVVTDIGTGTVTGFFFQIAITAAGSGYAINRQNAYSAEL